jgi:hypothetical protein
VLVLDCQADSDNAALAKKLEGQSGPSLMSAPLDPLRQRIADLARGPAQPVFKNILEYASMKATRTKTSKAR